MESTINCKPILCVQLERSRGDANKIEGFTCRRDCESEHVFGQRGELGHKQIQQVQAGEAAGSRNLSSCLANRGGEARTPESVAPPRRAHTEQIWLNYTRVNGRSCHKGTDIADKQQLMAFI